MKLPIVVDFTVLDNFAMELTSKLQEISDKVEIVGYEAPPEVANDMLIHHYQYILQLKGKEKCPDCRIVLRDIVLSPCSILAGRATGVTKVLDEFDFRNRTLKDLADQDPDSVLMGLVAYLLRKATDD